jgi:hypothetical protein
VARIVSGAFLGSALESGVDKGLKHSCLFLFYDWGTIRETGTTCQEVLLESSFDRSCRSASSPEDLAVHSLATFRLGPLLVAGTSCASPTSETNSLPINGVPRDLLAIVAGSEREPTPQTLR